ncbi:Ribokinase-like protein [Scenedesmus sp. NREL 46B-D3]|nr:Ribokinase-like protein [Scenedesmus sp. NREL 46B-D3]
MELVGFTLIIDDIVLPDGRTCMAQLGGGGPQTLFGFQLVSAALSPHNNTCSVGLAAGVGRNLPDFCKDWLLRVGCDGGGLLIGRHPTPRAWQVFEEDGRRTQIWRVRECDELYQQLRPSFSQLPAAFQSSVHYHLGIHAGHPPMKLLRALRDAAHARGGLLSVETYTACDGPPRAEQLAALLQAVDVFSPNEAEAASIVGPGSPQQLVQRLLAAGARTVSLRMGPQGALVADAPSSTMWHVPAVPGTHVVDVTGCGNAFCGGFMAGLHAGVSMLDAARWGCVAGSIMAEWRGVPPAEVLWAPLLQQAAAKHALLQAAGFEAGAFPQDWLVGGAYGGSSSSGCSSNTRDAAVGHAGAVVQSPGEAEAVPAASTSGSAVRSLQGRQQTINTVLSCCCSNPLVQQRQSSSCGHRSSSTADSSRSRLPRPHCLVGSKFAGGLRQRPCLRL